MNTTSQALEVRWHEQTTQTEYLQALAQWIDHAREELLTPGACGRPVDDTVVNLEVPHWVIVTHHFAVLRARPNPRDRVRLDSRVTRVGRTSLELESDVVDAAGAVIARCSGVVVLVTPGTMDKIPVPNGPAVAPHAAKPQLVGSTAIGDRPATAFRYPLATRPSDCDSLQHVTNARYLAYCQDALWAYLHRTDPRVGQGGHDMSVDTSRVYVEIKDQLFAPRVYDMFVWPLAAGADEPLAFGMEIASATPGGPPLMRCRAEVPRAAAKL